VDVVIYDDAGGFDQAALAALDRALRCRRTGEARAMDPRILEVLSMIHDRFGKPLDVVSGFRYQRNEESRHFHGAAVDLQVPGVDPREVAAFVRTLDAGGMGVGLYPAGRFVHIDLRAPGEPSYRWIDSRRRRRPDAGKQASPMFVRSTATAPAS
jgi:uncharacterized protein YcbK (DUF882 family)